MITIEEHRILEVDKMEFPGLISESLHCDCFLHGFEVDLDGNVIVPTLVTNQADSSNHRCSC